nr:cysteine synthase family protein [Longirhabdus pacifica]
MIRDTMLDCIGNTPLVRLKLDSCCKGNVYGKLELQNPFGMKDRVAKHIILEAKRRGELLDGAPIIESSSGTLACGVALVGTYLGHEVHIVTDPRIDSITLAKLTSLGCHVHVVDKMSAQGWQSARLERLQQMLQEMPSAFWPRQYENPDNPNAYIQCAEEIVADIPQVDILIGSVGSGGSLCGTAKALKQYHPNLKVVAVDAVGSVIFGQPDRPKRLQGGLGNSLIAKNVQHALVDEVHWLNDEEAFAATLQLAKEQQIFAGNSSGSVYAVARYISQQVKESVNIVAILPDRGDRYAHNIYHSAYHQEKGIHNLVLPREPQRVSNQTTVEHWSYAEMKGVFEHV